MTHFGDPCIHCGTPHDDVAPGACTGDRENARVLAYCVARQAYENPGSGCDTILCAMTNGDVVTDTRHPASWWWLNDWFKAATVLAPHEFRSRYAKDKPWQSNLRTGKSSKCHH
jgi:hypothetical protein